MRIFALAQNTFREAVRDKVLYVLLFMAVATILGSKVLGYVSIGQDIKIVTDISLTGLSVFGALIAVFVGTNLIYKEIDKRTIYTIICTPMWRFEFVLGKFFGLAAVLFVATLVMTAVAASYIAILGGTIGLTFLVAAVLTYVKLLLVTAIAVMLSSLTSPILGAIIVVAMYWFGHGTAVLIDLPGDFSPAAKTVFAALYYVIPNLRLFDITDLAANGVAVNPSYVGWAIVYGLVYTIMYLTLAALAFEDKDV
jgi:ABC-type transport system involved in multi-copper enzyme maturation permease subunit